MGMCYSKKTDMEIALLDQENDIYYEDEVSSIIENLLEMSSMESVADLLITLYGSDINYYNQQTDIYVALHVENVKYKIDNYLQKKIREYHRIYGLEKLIALEHKWKVIRSVYYSCLQSPTANVYKFT